MLAGLAVIVVGLLIGLVLGHYIKAATIARRNDPTAMWSAILTALVFLFSGGTSFLIIAGMETLNANTRISVLETIVLALSLLYGLCLGLACVAWMTFQLNTKRTALALLIPWGILLAVCGVVSMVLHSWQSGLYPVAGVSGGVIIGVVIMTVSRHERYNRLLQLLCQPRVMTAGFSFFAGLTLANSFIMQHARSLNYVLILIISLCVGAFLGLGGLFFTNIWPLRYQDVCSLLAQDEHHRRTDGSIRPMLMEIRHRLDQACTRLAGAEEYLKQVIAHLEYAEQLLTRLPPFCETPLNLEERAALIYNVLSRELGGANWTPEEVEEILTPALDRFRSLSKHSRH